MNPKSQPSIKCPIKFGQLEHIESLHKHGLLFLNTLEFYQTCEDEGRGDRNEGLESIHQHDKTQIELTTYEGSKIIINKNTGLIGQVKVSKELTKYSNVYCMFMLEVFEGKIQIDPRILSFGEAALVITKPLEFVNRFKMAFEKQNISFSSDFVEYIDETKHDGKIGVFRKYKRFSYQNEYRIVVPPSSGQPISISIGSLEDISVILNADSLKLPLTVHRQKFA